MSAPLRVLHVVSLVSPGGEYGGPTRVALNQARALAEAGHHPIVTAGHLGYATAPTIMDGVPVRLFPVRRLVPRSGFAGLSSPGMMRWLSAAARGSDVMHVHLARDLLTMPSALLARRLGVPYVVQTHGMIDGSSKALARVLDAVATRRVLDDAQAVFHLSERERLDLSQVAGPRLAFVELRNGVRAQTTPPTAGVERPETEVLYLARLHQRKHPLDFVDAAAALLPDHPDVTFRLIGPDEGEGASVSRAVARVGSARLRWDGPMPMDKVAAAMGRAAIYVLPSVDEPYPMTVLEAMSHGCAVVVTDSCGLAPLVARSGSGLVTPSGAPAVQTAVRQLLRDPHRRVAMGAAAVRTARTELGMNAVTRTLLDTYESARRQRKGTLR